MNISRHCLHEAFDVATARTHPGETGIFLPESVLAAPPNPFV